MADARFCVIYLQVERERSNVRPLSAELNTTHCLWSDVSHTCMHGRGRQLMWLSVFRNCIKCGLDQSIKLLVGRGDGGGEIINPADIAQ